MLGAQLSKTQIDRLGDRLREGRLEDADLRALDAYRRAFSEAYESVIQVIREEVGLEPTGRPAKSTKSIIDKLRRESLRLSQMQDIAGCRVTCALKTRWQHRSKELSITRVLLIVMSIRVTATAPFI